MFVSVFVLDIVGTVIPSTAITPEDTREIVVSVACQSSTEPTHSAVDVLAVMPATGNPVQFVSVPDEGVPSTGVVRVGLVRVLFVSVSVVALPTSVSLESCRVYVLLAVFVFVKNEVNVLATLRNPIIPVRNV